MPIRPETAAVMLIDRLNNALGDRYVVERELGRGGMGVVFLASDLKHGRHVALKVLPPELSRTLGTERFLSEIQVAARLQHPNIVPLYDSGAADGVLYYVMPYVAGEALRQRLRRDGPLPIDDAMEIARDVAEALTSAHASGVVHRDIKPENILLAQGRALVTDFGIARAISVAGGSGLTATGMIVGTLQYMAPEQMMGLEIDGRADVYALGVVVYEMLAGEPPYSGTAPTIVAKRLADTVPSVRRLRETVPVAVEQALVKALARLPADRFGSAKAFAEALVTPAPVLRRPGGRFVAVLPFLNLSTDPENEYFADGITEDVITQLSKIGALSVIARASVMLLKARNQSVQDIAASLGVTTLVDGSVRRAGNRVRIVAQLIDAQSGRQLWGETYDRELTDIFAIQTDAAMQIAKAMQIEISREERTLLAKEPTADLEAYHLYLKGRHCVGKYTEAGIRSALGYFADAIGRDPAFALAYTGLASTCVVLGMGFGGGDTEPKEAYRRGREAVTRALALDHDLGEAHGTLAFLEFVADFHWADAEREFKRALELDATSSFIWDAYGVMLSALGRYDEALTAQRRAQQLDPLTPVHSSDIASTLLRAGRYREAVDEARRLITLAPEYPMGHSTLGWASIKEGRGNEGLAELERAVTLSSGNTMLLAQLGQAYALLDKTPQARAVLQQLQDLSEHRYVSPYDMAYVYAGLGEHEKAIERLEQAFEDRAGGIYGVKGSFLFTALHAHPRFIALLTRMNLD